MDKRLLNTKTVVTGGSRGIGAGIVKRLFNEGSDIIIADILEDEANNLITVSYTHLTLPTSDLV